MRLTLRTLLAYLDDVLEPSETKLIGQKIQESAVAGKLVSLIKLVVRQRRLKAPSVSGPNMGIDPNIVAQYLDNTLAPDQVVEVEKVLLTSDELLAEVASCHQVLALVMGKPAEVSEASREKLYALGPVDQSEQLRVEETRSTAGNDGAVTAALARDAERQVPTKPAPATEIPEYLRQNSWSQRVVPTAIVALLIVVCLGLLIADPGFLTGIREAKRELTKAEPDATKIETPPADDAKPDASTTSPAAGQNPEAMSVASTVPTPATKTIPVTAPGIDPPPPADANPAPPPAPSDAPADAAVASNSVTTPATTIGPADPTPVLAPVAVQYTSNDGVALRLDEAQQHWYLLPRRSAIAPGEVVGVLEPFEAVLDIDRGGMIATVMGDTAVRLLSPDRMTATGLDVHRGRVLLRSARKDAAQSPVISVMVGKDLWRLEFLSADTTCTIEISPREPVQFEKPLGSNWYVGVLRVLNGSVKWTGNDGKSQTVKSEAALEIAPQQADVSVRPVPVSSAFAPEWTDPQKRKQSPLRRFAALFEKQFEPDQPVDMTLLALIKDSNAKIVELAVHGLAMTESDAGLAQALAECSYEEGRFAARDGLRTWVARETDRGPKLNALLKQHYPAPEASFVYQMLWGYRDEDAMNRAVSLELVNGLRSPHVEIRELAYYWIVRLSGRKWEYRATDVPARRESAVRKLEVHIGTAGALVKPTEKEAAPK